jgi:hypothetical protein
LFLSIFIRVVHTLFLPFSSFFARPPLFFLFKYKKGGKLTKTSPTILREAGGRGEKGTKKGAKKGYCEIPGWGSLSPPFFAPFLAPFLDFMRPGCSYPPSKVAYLKCSKRAGVNSSGFYSTLSVRHEKGWKRGVKKGYCEQPYSPSKVDIFKP